MLLRLVWASVTPHKSGSSVWPQTGQVVVSFPFVFWYFLTPQIPCSFILATPSTLVRELLYNSQCSKVEWLSLRPL